MPSMEDVMRNVEFSYGLGSKICMEKYEVSAALLDTISMHVSVCCTLCSHFVLCVMCDAKAWYSEESEDVLIRHRPLRAGAEAQRTARREVKVSHCIYSRFSAPLPSCSALPVSDTFGFVMFVQSNRFKAWVSARYSELFPDGPTHVDLKALPEPPKPEPSAAAATAADSAAAGQAALPLYALCLYLCLFFFFFFFFFFSSSPPVSSLVSDLFCCGSLFDAV
jgi:hypothetical protein